MANGIFVFLTGLVFGSFANVIILRQNTGESLIFRGSRCFFFGRALKWFELIPVISFFALRGKSRNCGSKISWQYPAVEIASGFLFLLLYLLGQCPVLAILFFWILLVISVYDFRHKIIPDSLAYSAIAVSVFFRLFDFGLSHIFTALGLFLFFAFLWLVSSGRWMGFGDAKLALAIGLFLGWPAGLVAFLVSFWLGAAVGVVYLFWSKSGSLKAQIPFAPVLSLGGLTAFLWGDFLISWYVSLL